MPGSLVIFKRREPILRRDEESATRVTQRAPRPRLA